MKKYTKDKVVKIAKEMYKEGTFFSEKYSDDEWNDRGWEEIDDKILYEALDSYIKFLRKMDTYGQKD